MASDDNNNDESQNMYFLDVSVFNCDDDLQFIPLPSSSHQQVPHHQNYSTFQSASKRFSAGGISFDDGGGDNNGSSLTPDLGCVNDLLV